MGVRRNRLAFERDFTQFPNKWARDKRISRRAKGLLVEIMSHRVGWRVTVAGLQEDGPEGRDAITTALNELRDAGYLIRSQSQDAGGRFKEVEYELQDPFAEPPTANGFPGSGDPAEETPAEELSTGPTAPWKTANGSTASGSTANGESATREEEKLLEDKGEEERAAVPAPPTPFCPRHPTGTDRPCRPCGDARRRFETWEATWPPAPPAAARYDPDVYCEHLQLRAGDCAACEQDARDAVTARFVTPVPT